MVAASLPATHSFRILALFWGVRFPRILLAMYLSKLGALQRLNLSVLRNSFITPARWQLNLTVMTKHNRSKITFTVFNTTNNFWWWMHIQCFEDGKVCENVSCYFIWNMLVASHWAFTFLIPLLCMCKFSWIFSSECIWEWFHLRRLPFCHENRPHGNEEKIHREVSAIVWKRCGLWRWKWEHGFASKFCQLLETQMMRNKHRK